MSWKHRASKLPTTQKRPLSARYLRMQPTISIADCIAASVKAVDELALLAVRRHVLRAHESCESGGPSSWSSSYSSTRLVPYCIRVTSIISQCLYDQVAKGRLSSRRPVRATLGGGKIALARWLASSS